jgi:hypothetical protein
MSKKRTSQLQRRPHSNPWDELQKLREEIENCEISYREARYTLLGHTFCIAQRLSADEGAWLAFIGDSFWDGPGRKPKPSDQEQALRFAVPFALSSRSESARKRASKYVRAMEGLPKGTTAAEVAAKLAEGGIEKRAQQAAERDSRRRTPQKN